MHTNKLDYAFFEAINYVECIIRNGFKIGHFSKISSSEDVLPAFGRLWRMSVGVMRLHEPELVSQVSFSPPSFVGFFIFCRKVFQYYPTLLC